ncbi:hypothetical protein WDU94_011776 [Cyamophila willieti]
MVVFGVCDQDITRTTKLGRQMRTVPINENSDPNSAIDEKVASLTFTRACENSLCESRPVKSRKVDTEIGKRE